MKIHTDELVDELQANQVDIDYITVPDGGHTDVAFSVLAQSQLRTEEAIQWLKSTLE